MTGSFTGSLCRFGGQWVHALRKSALCLGLSRTQVLQALLEGGDLAEPCAFFRFDEALLGVAGHLVDAAGLGRIDAQEPTPGARMFMDTQCAVGAVALAERHPAEQEVLFELGPLVVLGNPVFSEWAKLSTSFDERLVRGDDVLGENCGVSGSQSSWPNLIEMATVWPIADPHRRGAAKRLAEGTYSKHAVFHPAEKHEQLAQSRAPGPATANPWNPAHSLGCTIGPVSGYRMGSRGLARWRGCYAGYDAGWPSCESAKIDVGA